MLTEEFIRHRDYKIRYDSESDRYFVEGSLSNPTKGFKDVKQAKEYVDFLNQFLYLEKK
jgi:hypothetical protein